MKGPKLLKLELRAAMFKVERLQVDASRLPRINHKIISLEARGRGTILKHPGSLSIRLLLS